MIRVLIADDQPLVRDGLAAIIGADPELEVVGEATNGRQAVRLVQQLQPDVVLMDVRMPELDGIGATRAIVRGASASVRILVLTTYDVDAYVYEALRAGASGFLLKDAPRHQLLSGIRAVAAGDTLLAPAVTRRLVEQHLRRPAATETDAILAELTQREREILELVGRGLSNAEIAERLTLGESTVKTHVGRVFSKLSLRDRAQAVVLSYESGLIEPSGDVPEDLRR
jgi:DNA-binding NarL/FixJ family response regulator